MSCRYCKRDGHNSRTCPEVPSKVSRARETRAMADPKTLPEKLRWARVLLNIHGALADGENERIKRRIVRIVAMEKPNE